MYERFTDGARKAMQLATQEAQLFNHEYLGTEHLLVGLLKLGDSTATRALESLGIKPLALITAVRDIVQPGPEMVVLGKIPQTPRVKKVIEFAADEANQLGHNYVGTEHLLLGLVRETEGVAAQELAKVGLDIDVARKAVTGLLKPSQRRRIELDATLTPAASYDVEINGVKLGTFQKGESWNGLLELRRGGDKIIVTDQDPLLAAIAFVGPRSPFNAHVLSISPDLLSRCLPKDAT